MGIAALVVLGLDLVVEAPVEQVEEEEEEDRV